MSMKDTHRTIALALIGLLLVGKANAFSFGGSTYEIISGIGYSVIPHHVADYNWIEARDDAIARGGHLATFADAAEWNAVVAGLGLDGSPNYWLGGYQPINSPEPAGGWAWVDGTPWNAGWDAWESGEPNDWWRHWRDNEENYLMTSGDGSTWNDSAVGSEHWKNQGYILETVAESVVDVVSLPEPTSLGLFGLSLMGLAFSRRRQEDQ